MNDHPRCEQCQQFYKLNVESETYIIDCDCLPPAIEQIPPDLLRANSAELIAYMRTQVSPDTDSVERYRDLFEFPKHSLVSMILQVEQKLSTFMDLSKKSDQSMFEANNEIAFLRKELGRALEQDRNAFPLPSIPPEVLKLAQGTTFDLGSALINLVSLINCPNADFNTRAKLAQIVCWHLKEIKV